jgi:hypothetical protein
MEAKKFNERMEQIQNLAKSCSENIDPTRTILRKRASDVIRAIDECFEQIIALDRFTGGGTHDIGLSDGHARIVVHDPITPYNTKIEINMVINGKNTKHVLKAVTPSEFEQIEHTDDVETLTKLIDLYRKRINDCTLLNTIIGDWLNDIHYANKRVADAFSFINGVKYQ